LAARGHEFIAVNTDYDGQQFSKIDFTGIKQLLYKQCVRCPLPAARCPAVAPSHKRCARVHR